MGTRTPLGWTLTLWLGAFGMTSFPYRPAAGAGLPDGFVYLADVAPEITQDLRYAGEQNFTGAPVPGYTTSDCVLARATALALARANRDLAAQGLGLKVYDCYRPARATAAFMAWAKRPAGSSDPTLRYHPRIARQALVGAGYISAASSHSTGASVDVTLIPMEVGDRAVAIPDSGCGAPPDGSRDMGSGFDCFDRLSHAGAAGLSAEQRVSRETLSQVLKRHGFRSYSREWWHFTFAEAANAPVRDFVVQPR